MPKRLKSTQVYRLIQADISLSRVRSAYVGSIIWRASLVDVILWLRHPIT